AVFVAHEIHNAIVLLVTATLMPGGHMAHVVAARLVRLVLCQPGLGLTLMQLGRDYFDQRSTAGRCRFYFNQRHCIPRSLGFAGGEVDLLARLDTDKRLLPVP